MQNASICVDEAVMVEKMLKVLSQEAKAERERVVMNSLTRARGESRAEKSIW